MTCFDHKRAVRTAFSQSAACYDSVAEVQRQIADSLIRGLPFSSEDLILDAGCGTGFVSHLLQTQGKPTRIIALDHAYNMCTQAMQPQTICADLESLPLKSSILDLYCSSLAWQWTDPAKSAHEAARVLCRNGRLAVASLGPGTLHELRQAFANGDNHQHVLDFRSPGEYCQILTQAGFTEISIDNQPLKVFSPDLASLLRGIRALGATELGVRRRPGLLGRHAWKRIEAAYDLLREQEGLPLSYDVIYLYARKI